LKRKFLLVGVINYLFANLAFAFFWSFFQDVLGYVPIAYLVTFLSTFFSFSMQNYFTWASKKFDLTKFFNFLIFQMLITSVSIFIVPKISKLISINLILSQVIWSAIVVAIIWFASNLFFNKNL